MPCSLFSLISSSFGFSSFKTRRRPRSRRGSRHVWYYVSHKLSASLKIQHKDFGKQFLWTMCTGSCHVRHSSFFLLKHGFHTMFMIWNMMVIVWSWVWFPFFLRPCSSGSFSNFRSYSRGSSCCFRSYFNVFDLFICHYRGFLRFPYDSIRFHAYNYIIPYDSMHGTIWFHAIPCMETAWNYRMAENVAENRAMLHLLMPPTDISPPKFSYFQCKNWWAVIISVIISDRTILRGDEFFRNDEMSTMTAIFCSQHRANILL